VPQKPRSARVAAVSALDDPTRRALYDLVSSSPAPVSRDEAAAAVGLSRSTAAFHLDRLAQEGLLTVEFRRPAGRSGPGAGRPAKYYVRSTAEVTVSVPERDYELAADIFARAITEATTTRQHVRDTLRRIAAETGRETGERAGDFDEALVAGGYEPRPDPAGGVVMGNCPFHRLAQHHTELVCELNYQLLDGVAQGLPGCGRRVVADPGAGRCCIRVYEEDVGPAHEEDAGGPD
jgi:predicted ArsR family transcriptional regulator